MELAPYLVEMDLNMKAVIYTRPQPLNGVNLPPEVMQAILITDEEYRIYENYGIQRLLSNMGFTERYFPHPPWSVRSRENFVSMTDMQSSVLSNVVSSMIPEARVTKIEHPRQKECIKLWVSPDSHEAVKKFLSQLKPNQPFTVYTELDKDVDSCLVWKHPQKNPMAINVDDVSMSRVSGSFIIFCPEQSTDGYLLVEDGFSMLITNDTYNHIYNALSSRDSFSTEINDNTRFELEWSYYTLVLNQKIIT